MTNGPSTGEKLLEALSKIKGTGNFHSTDHRPFFLPGICLPDGEEIAFPLSPVQADVIKKHCEPAPYGQGEDTILDQQVRSCWQMDATHLTWSKAWEKALKKILKSIRADLGIDEEIIAAPHKLLLYEKGGHFKRHRDTEKLGSMFGSLIIALPAAHQGGTLQISHNNTDIAINFGENDHWRDLQYAAFFADCEHEVLPVTSGNRLCLAYNLALKDSGNAKLNTAVSTQAATLLPHLKSLRPESKNDLCAILLDHQYTAENLSLRGLKNHDNARGHALMHAAREAGFIPHLALVTLHQMGALEEDWEDGGYQNQYIEDGAMGEVYEESLSISTWLDDKDRPANFGDFHIASEQILSNEEIGSGEPLEKESEGYTGNAGCTMDYWYHHAAIVLWSRENHESILTQHDLSGCCQLLLEQSKEKAFTQKPTFLRLALAAIKTISENSEASENDFHRTGEIQPAFPLLDAIFNAQVPALDQACSGTLLPHILPSLDASRITKLIDRFGSNILKILPESTSTETQFNLLSALLSLNSPPAENAVHLAQRTPKLLLEQDTISSWQSRELPGYLNVPSRLHIALAASFLITEKSTRQELSDIICKNDDLDHLRDTLATTLRLKTHVKHLTHPNSLYPKIHQRILATLQSEIKRPLNPYPDWWRPIPEKEKYNHIDTALKKFLADRNVKEHRFKAVQATRSKLESQIRHQNLDIKFHTEKKGSPHTLVCIKTNASYKRALQRRTKDEALFAELSKLRA